MAAQASTLSLNFEDLSALVASSGSAGYALSSNQYAGIQIVNNCAVGDPSCLAPTAFSGSSMGIPAGTGVYLLGSDFTINILPGFQFDAFTLSLIPTVSGTLGYTVGTLTTSSGLPISIVSTGGSPTWTAVDALNGQNIGEIISINFTEAVGIDNLSLTYSGTTTGGGTGGSGGTGGTGGSVPEPASFGLAALALLGAGLSRRKQQR